VPSTGSAPLTQDAFDRAFPELAPEPEGYTSCPHCGARVAVRRTEAGTWTFVDHDCPAPEPDDAEVVREALERLLGDGHNGDDPALASLARLVERLERETKANDLLGQERDAYKRAAEYWQRNHREAAAEAVEARRRDKINAEKYRIAKQERDDWQAAHEAMTEERDRLREERDNSTECARILLRERDNARADYRRLERQIYNVRKAISE
jgi:hypothetical protein